MWVRYLGRTAAGLKSWGGVLFLLSLGMVVLPAGMASAERLSAMELAEKYEKDGKYRKAMEIALALVGQNEQGAQALMKRLKGVGFKALKENDYDLAISVFEPIAESSHEGAPVAQLALGSAYLLRDRLPSDKATAAAWMWKSAKAGTGRAQLILGLLYRDGEGVPVDLQQAERWLMKAVEQEEKGGLFNLLSVYVRQGRMQDPRARRYVEENSRRESYRSDAETQYRVGQFFELAGFYSKAFPHFLEAAQMGHTEAMRKMWEYYSTGKGTDLNLEEAQKWQEMWARIEEKKKEEEREALRKEYAQMAAEMRKREKKASGRGGEGKEKRKQEKRDLEGPEQYIHAIREKVERNWIQPDSRRKGLSCLVKVTLSRGGDVKAVQIAEGSGDAAFDRSVEAAVYRASPLPVPKDARLFKRFQRLTFRFRPR